MYYFFVATFYKEIIPIPTTLLLNSYIQFAKADFMYVLRHMHKMMI